MDIEEQFNLEHLFLSQRKCRTCSKVKNLIDEFYLTRKDRGSFASSYSYECKECTIKRVKKNKKCAYNSSKMWEYPDW